MSGALGDTRVALGDTYSVLLMDLDGTLNRGDVVVSGAEEAMATARAAGRRLAFVTNNASRSPAEIADHLSGLGIAADSSEVITSAQAGARALATLVAPRTGVLVVGGPALADAVAAEGLTAVSAAAEAAAVIQGWDPALDWRLLAEGAYALEAGALWVATNVDLTLPTAGGIAPGNGSFVELLASVTGRRPDLVAGKPGPAMLLAGAAEAGRATLVVGDRLDTDIAGATAADLDSLLVLTGVTSLAQLLHATPDERPTYVSLDLTGLAEVHPPVLRLADGWASGDARVVSGPGALELAVDGSDLEVLRAVVVAAWDISDDCGQPPFVGTRVGDRLGGLSRD